MVVYWLSRVWYHSWTVAHQAPLSMGFPTQEYWSGLPFPPPGRSSWHRDQKPRLLHFRQILYWLSHQESRLLHLLTTSDLSRSLTSVSVSCRGIAWQKTWQAPGEGFASRIFLLTPEASWKVLLVERDALWEINQDLQSCLGNSAFCQPHQRKTVETSGWYWLRFLGEGFFFFFFFRKMNSFDIQHSFQWGFLGRIYPGSTYKQGDQGVLLGEE